jgi:hypothetical protein
MLGQSELRQSASQASPPTVLPSSQTSGGITRLSPQMGLQTLGVPAQL